VLFGVTSVLRHKSTKNLHTPHLPTVRLCQILQRLQSLLQREHLEPARRALLVRHVMSVCETMLAKTTALSDELEAKARTQLDKPLAPPQVWSPALQMLREALFTFHLPVHRFVSQALALLPDTAADVFYAAEPPLIFTTLARRPLDAVASLAQVRSRLWVWNGENIVEQGHLYCSAQGVILGPGFADSLRAQDMLALQLNCAVNGPEPLLAQAVTRFGLGVVFGACCALPAVTEDLVPAKKEGKTEVWTEASEVREWGADKYLTLVEQFLYFLVELATPTAAMVTAAPKEEALKRQLTHRLLLGKKKTYSGLLKGVHFSLAKHDRFDAVLDEVATYVPPSITNFSPGHFELRASQLENFDPYYAIYTALDRADAEQEYHAIRERAALAANALYPPIPAPQCVSVQFQTMVPHVLASPTMIAIVASSFRLASSSAVPAAVKARFVDHATRLLVLGIVECKRETLALPAFRHDFLTALTFQSCNEAADGDARPRSCIELVVSLLLSGDGDSANVTKAQRQLLEWICRALCDLDSTHAEIRLQVLPWIEAAAAQKSEEEKQRLKAIRGDAMKKRKRGIIEAMAKKRQRFANHQAHQAGSAEEAAEDVAAATAAESKEERDEICIVCRESKHDLPLGLVCRFQKSHTLRALADRAPHDALHPNTASGTAAGKGRKGIQILTCGHTMHFACLTALKATLRRSEVHMDDYPGMHSIRVEKHEFLCPLCQAPSNSLIPLLPLGSGGDTVLLDKRVEVFAAGLVRPLLFSY
jgi:E3 ubiquitin-protein ligase UBR2